MSLPTPTSLRTLPDEQIQDVLDILFEPSPSIMALLLPSIRSNSVKSYAELANLVRGVLLSQPSHSPTLLEILSSHPRLGADKVDSTQSQNEQKSLGNEAEREQLQKLNEEYENAFPGLRYVVFVNGRSRDIIMEDMNNRIQNGTFEGEVKRACEAMCDIAIDRAKKLGQD
jgi:2-oxo-4-hydroxy-4-carboxy--5-ureidoimidazoline (OHCU) decarboxylase